MTMGSPRRFFSARRGSVIGRRSMLEAPVTAGGVDMCASFRLTPRLGGQGRHLVVYGHDPVVAGHVDDPRTVIGQLDLVVAAVGEQDHGVAAGHHSRRRAVELHLAGAALARDRVRGQPGPVVYVEHLDLLVLGDVGGLEQIEVDGHRSDVVQVAIGHRRPVDLRLQHHALHQLVYLPLSGARPGRTVVLSISRATPTRAATASRVSPSIVATGDSVSGETSSRYSGSTPYGSMASRAALATAWASRSPSATDRSAATSARCSATARRRSGGRR